MLQQKKTAGANPQCAAEAKQAAAQLQKELDATDKLPDVQKAAELVRILKKSVDTLGDLAEKYGLKRNELMAIAFARDPESFKRMQEFFRNPPQTCDKIEAALPSILPALMALDKVLSGAYDYGSFGTPRYDRLRGETNDIFGATGCGPRAVMLLLWAENCAPRGVSARDLALKLMEAASPGIFGTDPSRLDHAARTVTDGNVSLRRAVFDKPEDTMRFVDDQIKQGRAVIVKIGSSLFSQHYAVLDRGVDTPYGRVYFGPEGIAVPASRLPGLCSQSPHANNAWVIERRPPIYVPPPPSAATRPAEQPDKRG